MTLEVFEAYKKAFGIPMDEKLINVLKKAQECGMTERAVLTAIYNVQNRFERGYLKESPGTAVANQLRNLYRGGWR